jgi:hypothetical protein
MKGEIQMWMTGDFISELRRMLRCPQSETNLLARSPVLCGRILLWLKLAYQQTGLSMVNSWGLVPAAAGLYNAQQLAGIIDASTRWPDVDLLESVHGTKGLYGVDTKPESLRATTDAFGRVLGFSPDSRRIMYRKAAGLPIPTSLRRRVERNAGHPADGVRLQDQSKLASLLFSKHLPGHDKVDITALLSDMLRRQSAADSTTTTHSSLRRKRRHNTPKGSIVQLLAVLEAELSSPVERVSIHFDYIALHMQCAKALIAVRNRIDAIPVAE